MNFSDFLSSSVSYLFGALFVLIWVLIAVRFIKTRSASVKTLKATVVDKYISQNASHYPGDLIPKAHTVVFLAGGKRLSFNVSAFSYESYRINDSGLLKYKGKTLIDFR